MWAYVSFGNTQIKVKEGDTVEVFPLQAKEGEEITLPVVALLEDKELVFEPEKLSGVKVRCQVVATRKGKKVYSFRKKPKTGYKRGVGHRDRLMVLKVLKIEKP
ncbi:MAG TPA: 50S ribosomal protein L21 [bacterium]|nr:50S ribosomal protein L21 [bacterium]HOL67891.1 50S ribosomal protein L21 [bacterium]HPP12538.1 50S ribosomal protein L21 [bacterium]